MVDSRNNNDSYNHSNSNSDNNNNNNNNNKVIIIIIIITNVTEDSLCNIHLLKELCSWTKGTHFESAAEYGINPLLNIKVSTKQEKETNSCKLSVSGRQNPDGKKNKRLKIWKVKVFVFVSSN